MDSDLKSGVEKRGDGNGRGREAIDGWRLLFMFVVVVPPGPKQAHEGALHSFALAFGSDPWKHHDTERLLHINSLRYSFKIDIANFG